MAVLEYRHLEEALSAYGREVAERYKGALDAHGKNATRRLRESVRPVLERTEEAFTLKLALEDYWKYLERGTRLQGPYRQQGKFPPLRPFVQWVQDKGLPLRGKSVEAVARAVAYKVWRDGTRPLWLLRESLGEEPEVRERMQAAVRADLEDWINAEMAEVR